MKGIVNKENDKNLQTLIEEARGGSKDAFREIFMNLNDKLYAYALSRTNNREDATDVVQETFVELWKALKRFKYKSDGEFYGFVYKIMKRRLSRHYSSKRNDVSLDEEFIFETYEITINDYRHVMNEVGRLRSGYQELLRLRYWSGMSYPEIALAMNIKEGTAKVWHHRAMQKLKINVEE